MKYDVKHHKDSQFGVPLLMLLRRTRLSFSPGPLDCLSSSFCVIFTV